MNVIAAREYCRTHHTDLVSIRNPEENQLVREVADGHEIYWIGLFRDSWIWSDGRYSSFRFWMPGTKTRVLNVKVRSENLQDLNDPATKAAILKQMQQLVKDTTLTDGHKLSWRTQADGQVFTREQCHQDDCDSVN
ncbi:hypothetical protein NHX12_009187 [Muraenolepis orangiensis]|uniref:C-type lectin domain-containing protein n=1 Tax=Muraenolepis orangiensis TaxID=630683 RepID=A0A9Q0DPB2_9TELE|nr:hypothetical protein NHX12_009187 [Muraenolepis orangiensis]